LNRQMTEVSAMSGGLVHACKLIRHQNRINA
jgi:hypothetical protein